MRPLTVKRICELTDGAIVGQVNPAAIVEGCVIDSRDVQQGDAFFALRGTQQHGISFAASALRDGANVVIADEAMSASCQTPHVAVEDVEIALAQLAQANRRQSDALVVGITGSVGKTSTKELTAAAIRGTGLDVGATKGNLNNHIGAPLTLFRIAPEHRFAVIELGRLTLWRSVRT